MDEIPDQNPGAPSVRPYFVPAGVDFDALPPAVQTAFREIIEPTYRELVMAAKTGLERSAAATLVFLLAQEVLEQFAIGRQTDYAQTHDGAQIEERHKLLTRHLKLVASKQQAANFLLRLNSLRAKHQFVPLPPGLD